MDELTVIDQLLMMWGEEEDAARILLKRWGLESPSDIAVEELADLMFRTWSAEESNEIWCEVAKEVCEAAGVAWLVQVPEKIRELRANASPK